MPAHCGTTSFAISNGFESESNLTTSRISIQKVLFLRRIYVVKGLIVSGLSSVSVSSVTFKIPKK